jgi:hypothetical protein
MSLAGRESGLIGTVETRIGEEVIASKRNNPRKQRFAGAISGNA